MSGVKIYNVGMKAVKFSPSFVLPQFNDLYTSKIALGYNFGVTANTDNTVSSWGSNAYGQLTGLDTITNAESVHCTSWRVVVLTNEGDIIIQNIDNPFSTSADNDFSFPTDVKYNQVHTKALSLNTRDDPITAIDENDTVYSRGTFRNGVSAVHTSTISGVKSVAYTDSEILAVDGNGSIQLLVGSGLVIPASTNNKTVKIDGGADHVVALLDDGTVVAFGSSQYSQTSVPAGLTDVIDISAGRYHGAALKSDGSIVTWGSYYDGSIKPFPQMPTGNVYLELTSAWQALVAYDDAGNLYLVGESQTGLTNWNGSGYSLV